MSPKRSGSSVAGVHPQQVGNNLTYDSVSPYGTFNNNGNGHLSMQEPLGPNAPDDLKSVPAIR